MKDDELNLENDEGVLRYGKECLHDFRSGSYGTNIKRGLQMREVTYEDDGQWADEDKQDYLSKYKARFTLNQLRPFLRQMVTENMISKPSVEIVGATKKVKSEEVELIAGWWRQVCYDSDIDSITNLLTQDQLDLGWAAMVLLPTNASDDDFNANLMIKQIDATMCGWDVSATSKFKTNGDWAFYLSSVNRRKLKAFLPSANLNAASFPLPGNKQMEAGKNNIVVMHFYYRTYYKDKKVRVRDENGNINIYKASVWRKMIKEIREKNEKLQADYDEALERKEYPEYPSFEHEPEIIQRTESVRSKVHYALMTTQEVLFKEELPIEDIPLIFVPGDVRKMRDGEITQPFAVDAKTPQQILNMAYSEIGNSIQRSIGTRIIAEKSTIRDSRQSYIAPTQSTLMEYSLSNSGGGATPPQIVSGPSFDPNLLSLAAQAREDIQMAIGRYGDNMGQQTNAEAGVAIDKRTLNGNLTSGVYSENLKRALGEITKVALAWVDNVLDTDREIKVRFKDGTTETKRINRSTGKVDESGNDVLENRINSAAATVHVAGGLSFVSQTLAAIDFLMRFSNTDPDLKHITYDVILDLASRIFGEGQKIVKRMYETGYIDSAVVKDEKMEVLEKTNPTAAQKMKDMMMDLKMREIQVKEKQAETAAAMQKLQALEVINSMRNDNIQTKAELLKGAGEFVKDKMEIEKDVFNQAQEARADVAKALAEIVGSQADLAEKGIDDEAIDDASDQVSGMLTQMNDNIQDIYNSYQSIQ